MFIKSLKGEPKGFGSNNFRYIPTALLFFYRVYHSFRSVQCRDLRANLLAHCGEKVCSLGSAQCSGYLIYLNFLNSIVCSHSKVTICSWHNNDQKWSKNGHLWGISFQNLFFQNWKKIWKPKKVFHVVAFDLIRI